MVLFMGRRYSKYIDLIYQDCTVFIWIDAVGFEGEGGKPSKGSVEVHLCRGDPPVEKGVVKLVVVQGEVAQVGSDSDPDNIAVKHRSIREDIGILDRHEILVHGEAGHLFEDIRRDICRKGYPFAREALRAFDSYIVGFGGGMDVEIEVESVAPGVDKTGPA